MADTAPLRQQLGRPALGLLARALFRVRLAGLDLLPRGHRGRPVGGWLACGLPHRTWLEPLLLLSLVPRRLPLVVLASGPTVRGSRWRRLLVGLVADVDPVWPGGRAAELAAHAERARQVTASGGVYAIFPEIGRPARAPRLRRLSAGVAVIAAAAQSPVVPIVFGGTHELYLGRRVVVRVLPPIGPPAASGPAASRAFIDRLLSAAAAPIEAAHAVAEAGAPARRRWRWLHGPFPRSD